MTLRKRLPILTVLRVYAQGRPTDWAWVIVAKNDSGEGTYTLQSLRTQHEHLASYAEVEDAVAVGIVRVSGQSGVECVVAPSKGFPLRPWSQEIA